MAKKKMKDSEHKESKDMEPQFPITVQPPQKKEVVLEGDPEVQLAYAAKAANALMSIVNKKKNPVMIRGKQYLEFGDWQVLARFYGSTVEIEWTHPVVNDQGKIKGYEARALVRRQGEIISSAEGMCTTDEARWKDAEEYAVRSMAQTRTSAKALRNAFGWVAELAGYQSTPAEEMPQEAQKERMPSYQVARVVPDESDEAGGYRGTHLNQTEPPFPSKRVAVPVMDSTNDAHGLDAMTDKKPHSIATDEKQDGDISLKIKIANLLSEKCGYIMLGKSQEEVAKKVMDVTGIKLEPHNYGSIIEELKFI